MFFVHFFIHAIIAIRYTYKIAAIAFNDNNVKKERKVRCKKIQDSLNEKVELLAQDAVNSYRKMLQEDKTLIAYYTRIRDSVEHVENDKMELTKYTYYCENTKLVINKPMYKDSCCDALMKVSFENLYTYIEDFIGMLLNLSSNKLTMVNKFEIEKSNNLKNDDILDIGSTRYKVSLIPNIMDLICTD